MKVSESYFEKARLLYATLQKHSKNGVFEGSMAVVYRETGASQAHYSKLFDYLSELGCIEIERKGRAGLTSVIRLHQKPSKPAFDQIYQKPLTRLDKADILTLGQRVSNLESAAREGRLGEIDLSGILSNIEGRLRRLENG